MSHQQLILGDCFDELPRLAAASVDMVFCDLPYGVTANKWDCVLPLDALWDRLMRVVGPATVFVFSATMQFAQTLIASQPKLFRYELVWDKGVAGSFHYAKYRPMPLHELLLIFSKGKGHYTPLMVPRDKPMKSSTHAAVARNSGTPRIGLVGRVYTHRYPTSILSYSSRSDKRIHPTQKPVALIEWLIRTYCPEGGTVLDPTAGVGTTAVACYRAGRRGICIERDPVYHAAAVSRVAEERT